MPRLLPAASPPLAFVALLLVGLSWGCWAGGEDETAVLRVSAAASLRDVVTELASEFEARHGVAVELNFAGSNVLAQQIRAAPQADVFLSADRRWVDDLLAAERLAPGSDRAIFSNQLVVVARPDAELAVGSLPALAALVTDAAAGRSLVLADPEGVPAGRYAKAYLRAEGVWQAVLPRVVPALDVRSALALVETDPSLIGIVYRTDAAASKRAQTLLQLPPRVGIDIVYWGARVDKAGDGADSATDSTAGIFLDFLASDAARVTADRHGFLPAGPAGPSG